MCTYQNFLKSGETFKMFSLGYLVSAVMCNPKMLSLSSRCSEIYQQCVLNQALAGRFEQNTFPLIDQAPPQTPIYFCLSKTRSSTGLEQAWKWLVGACGDRLCVFVSAEHLNLPFCSPSLETNRHT